MSRVGRSWHLALIAGLVLVVGLQVTAIHQHSLSGDGAYHLIAGDQMLRYGQNRINFEHPPLVKLLIALPQLTEDEPLMPPLAVDEALAAIDRVHRDPERLWRATVAARYVALILFALPFLTACWLLGRVYFDPRTGLVLLFLVGLSLSVVPNLTILQTDAAVALGFVLTLVAIHRYARRDDFSSAALVGLAAGLAISVKYSGLLIAPTLLLAVFLPRRRGAPWWRAPAQLALIVVAALAVLGLSYALANTRYDPELGREAIRLYCRGEGTLIVGDHLRDDEAAILAVERVDPWLAQWLTGFAGIRVQDAIGVYPSYAFGEIRPEGRWWYFPAVLLIKTPLAILVAAAALAVLAVVRRRGRSSPGSTPEATGSPASDSGSRPEAIEPSAPRFSTAPLWLTAAVYLAVAMSSSYNLGVRHLLPILPLLYLPVARGLARRPRAAVVVVAVLALESVLIAPLWMSATNTWWLGERNPTRFVLSAGNLEYKQNFVQLAKYARRNGLERLNVVYPAIGEAVVRAYLPDARLVRAGGLLEPGWYAVTIRMEQYMPILLRDPPNENLARLAAAWEEPWQRITAGEDHGYVAGTFHLYRLREEE